MDSGVAVAWRHRRRGLGRRECRRLTRHHSGGEDAHPRRARDRQAARPPLRTGLQPLPAQCSILHRVAHSEQAKRAGAVPGHLVPHPGTVGGSILF